MAGRLTKPSVVAVANETVPITTACRLIGMSVPDDIGYGRAMKLRCPFGEIWHSDQGAEASMRVYVDSNSLYCFSRCGYFSPVSLVAAAWDLTLRAAAVELLEHIGHKPVSLAEAWAQANRRDDTPDHTLLSEALKTYCRRVAPTWDDDQFHPHIAATLTRCLALLDRVTTAEDAHTWLAGCKQAMTRAFTTVQSTR